MRISEVLHAEREKVRNARNIYFIVIEEEMESSSSLRKPKFRLKHYKSDNIEDIAHGICIKRVSTLKTTISCFTLTKINLTLYS